MVGRVLTVHLAGNGDLVETLGYKADREMSKRLVITLVSLIEGGEVVEGGVFIPANFQ